MIITQTPFRMSFFGGGTDMESFFRENGGAVLSTTFDKYCYVNVRHLPRFFDYSTELSYSKTERVTCIEDIQHPAIRNAMKMLDIPKNLVPTMLNVGTKIWGSFDLSDADACKALAHTDIPLLIIHGDEDMKAPLSMAYKLYDSCNGEKQLYIVHGADHTENYRKDPGGYEKIVTKFIEERLRQKKCQTPGTKL